MANILSVSSGYKRTCYEVQFTPYTGVTLQAGDLVVKTDATTVNKATLADGEDKVVYIVLEGNDTYSGNTTGKVVCLAGALETTVSDYITGSYAVDTPLTAQSGKFAVKTGTKKVIGHVLSFSLSQGLKVRFHN